MNCKYDIIDSKGYSALDYAKLTHQQELIILMDTNLSDSNSECSHSVSETQKFLTPNLSPRSANSFNKDIDVSILKFMSKVMISNLNNDKNSSRAILPALLCFLA